MLKEVQAAYIRLGMAHGLTRPPWTASLRFAGPVRSLMEDTVTAYILTV